MCDEKRKRSPNWLPSEKTLLLDLVEKHYSIVENKKTDGVSVKAKLAEWQNISVKYNSQTTYCPRPAENLKSQWENMKKAAKKGAAHARMRRIQTGGGPPDPKKEDPICLRILSLITTSAVGLYNKFDSDCSIPIKPDSELSGSESECLPSLAKTDKMNERYQPLSATDINIGASTSMVIENEDWGDYTPQLLKTPISAPLKKGKTKSEMSRRRPLNTPFSSLELHKEKIKAIHLQMELALEEAEYKKKQAQLDIELKEECLKQAKIKTRKMLMDLREKKKNKENSVSF